MLNGKATIVLLTVELKKRQYKWVKYFPEPKSLGGRVKVRYD